MHIFWLLWPVLCTLAHSIQIEMKELSWKGKVKREMRKKSLLWAQEIIFLSIRNMKKRKRVAFCVCDVQHFASLPLHLLQVYSCKVVRLCLEVTLNYTNTTAVGELKAACLLLLLLHTQRRRFLGNPFFASLTLNKEIILYCGNILHCIKTTPVNTLSLVASNKPCGNTKTRCHS